VFPQVNVSPANGKTVAVAWRQYSLPVDTNAAKGARTAECHVSLSTDAGKTFKDTNLMPYLRRERISAAEPELWFCNAPWVTFGRDGTVYAGGSVYTANGETGPEPKQGRAMVTVSRDGGTTWSKGVFGVKLDKFAPGLTGLNGGMEPKDTPWDGSNGFVDPTTGTFYSTAGAYIAASNDHGATFGTVHSPTVAGWPQQRVGTMTSVAGTLAAPFIATQTPVAGTNCPCLALATSTDQGKTFTPHLVAQAKDFNSQSTTRYPVAAADPAHPGHFAITVYAPDHNSVKVFYTENGGQTWKSAAPRPEPSDPPVVSTNQVGVGYTADGRILLVWRGFHRDAGAFDTFAALLNKDHFGATVKVSPQPSVYPTLTYLGNYGVGTGANDFTTWITGSKDYAFVAFPYAPMGLVEDTDFARIPLSSMN
jgi:hypothetical protein